MVHRCAKVADQFGDAVELIDLRTIAPWDRQCVLDSVRKTGRCLVVHEDNLTAGFGAEIVATIAQDAFWHLDAPVHRLAPRDIPMPYHPTLLDAVLPTTDDIADEIAALLRV
jgi:2-oxoisovalerate dehydrogenase E1 component